ncbi:MAG: hypothetical protein ACON41_00980 [Parvibaculales bacterium]
MKTLIRKITDILKPNNIAVVLAVFVLLSGYLHIAQHQLGVYHDTHFVHENGNNKSSAPDKQEIQHESECLLQKTAEIYSPPIIIKAQPPLQLAQFFQILTDNLTSQYRVGFSARAPPANS